MSGAPPTGAALHWGGSASWRGAGWALSFDAALGVVPPVVSVPPRADWPAAVAPLHDRVCADFAALGAEIRPCRGAVLRCTGGPAPTG